MDKSLRDIFDDAYEYGYEILIEKDYKLHKMTSKEYEMKALPKDCRMFLLVADVSPEATYYKIKRALNRIYSERQTKIEQQIELEKKYKIKRKNERK